MRALSRLLSPPQLPLHSLSPTAATSKRLQCIRDLCMIGLWARSSEVSLTRDLLALLVHSCECLAFFRRRAFAVHHVVLPLTLRTAHQHSYGSTPSDSNTHPPRKQCRRGRLPCLCPAWNPDQNHRHTSCHPASSACHFPACEINTRLGSQAPE